MKKMIVLLLVTVAVALGCVRSINPFYTEDVTTTCKAIGGNWQILDGNGKPCGKSWFFNGNEILTVSESGVNGILKAQYFNIGSNLFLDTSAGDMSDTLVCDWWQMHTLPVHFVSRVELADDKLVIKPLNNEWFLDNLDQFGFSTGCMKTGQYDTIIMSVTSEQWVEFLKKYGTNDEAFSEKSKYTYVRPVKPTAKDVKNNEKKSK